MNARFLIVRLTDSSEEPQKRHDVVDVLRPLQCWRERRIVPASRGLPATGEALRDGNGDLIKYNFGNTNWIPLMLRNSSFIIQPEEVLADNFATLMEWRSDGVLPPANPGGFLVNDVDLLTAIERVLADSSTRPRAASQFQFRTGTPRRSHP